MKQILSLLFLIISCTLSAQDYVKIENLNGKKYYVYLIDEGVSLESLSTDFNQFGYQ